ncbi:MAG: hypothetical protein IKR17_13665 [Bacteroidales bacterium]|nr:hypothetical protein [Bacteroidales bacterium]
MVKDIRYFLDEENAFCQNHPNYGETYWNEELGEMSVFGIDDRLNYLSDRVFSNIYKTIKEPLGREIEFGLSDAQRVLLRLFYRQHSAIFRDDYYHSGITDFVQNLFDTLDDMIKKAPISNDSILYRFCTEYDKTDMNIGDKVTFHHNLTCTNFDWNQAKYTNVYYISPLKEGKTKAHSLYEIYEHGDEKQVDFLRNVSFLVKGVDNTIGTSYKKFYLEEIV